MSFALCASRGGVFIHLCVPTELGEGIVAEGKTKDRMFPWRCSGSGVSATAGPGIEPGGSGFLRTLGESGSVCKESAAVGQSVWKCALLLGKLGLRVWSAPWGMRGHVECGLFLGGSPAFWGRGRGGWGVAGAGPTRD